ncbi:hypothetical protein [Hoeflea sp.]|nr:hypothetical protein [Hoeflea sp.]
MRGKGFLTAAAAAAVGVFVAGWIMNAMRDNDVVKSAINGFDA